MKVRNHIIVLLLAVLLPMSVFAQERTVQNRPYTDLRKFHFGILVGAHLQDLEFKNVGPQVVQSEDGSMVDALVTTDQDRWDPGFTVGVLGELRLNTNFQLRVAPAMFFGTHHITFHNYKDLTPEGVARQQHQSMKVAYISAAVDLIFAGPRFNNHRPYMMAGVNPVINLNNKMDDFLKLNRTDVFLELGVGCDFYLPFFKLRPELKFMYGLTNSLDKTHVNRLRDKTKIPYTQSVNDARSKIVALTFYFE